MTKLRNLAPGAGAIGHESVLGRLCRRSEQSEPRHGLSGVSDRERQWPCHGDGRAVQRGAAGLDLGAGKPEHAAGQESHRQCEKLLRQRHGGRFDRRLAGLPIVGFNVEAGNPIPQNHSPAVSKVVSPAFTGSISGTVLTVSAVTSGTISVGEAISGSGISPPQPSPGTISSEILSASLTLNPWISSLDCQGQQFDMTAMIEIGPCFERADPAPI